MLTYYIDLDGYTDGIIALIVDSNVSSHTGHIHTLMVKVRDETDGTNGV